MFNISFEKYNNSNKIIKIILESKFKSFLFNLSYQITFAISFTNNIKKFNDNRFKIISNTATIE